MDLANRIWFLSDLHIRSPQDDRYSKLSQFLEARLSDSTTDIFLVGDIFDLWFGSSSFFAQRYSTVCALIQRLVQAGVRIHYFEGNHDLHLGLLWEKKFGVKVYQSAHYFDLCGKSVRVEHGDQMNPADTGYLFLRRVLRSTPFTWLSAKLSGHVIQTIGDFMSSTSRRWTSSHVKAIDKAGIQKMIRLHAESVYLVKPFDLIISGHVHVRDDQTWQPVEGREIRSINLGSWLPKPIGEDDSYVLLMTDEGLSWVAITLN